MSIQFRILANGHVCCSSRNASGERIAPKHPCDACKAHFATIGQENINMENYDAPNPYTLALEARAASEGQTAGQALQTFAAQHKADALRTLAAEHAEIDASIEAARQPRLTAAELAEFDPPDPYAAGIKALQLKEASAR